jgi:hypothetical protein
LITFLQRSYFINLIVTTSAMFKGCPKGVTSIITVPPPHMRDSRFSRLTSSRRILLAPQWQFFSAAIANRAKRIVFCSSMARYGALKAPFTEDQTPKPQDPYGHWEAGSRRIIAKSLHNSRCSIRDRSSAQYYWTETEMGRSFPQRCIHHDQFNVAGPPADYLWQRQAKEVFFPLSTIACIA